MFKTVRSFVAFLCIILSVQAFSGTPAQDQRNLELRKAKNDIGITLYGMSFPLSRKCIAFAKQEPTFDNFYPIGFLGLPPAFFVDLTLLLPVAAIATPFFGGRFLYLYLQDQVAQYLETQAISERSGN